MDPSLWKRQSTSQHAAKPRHQHHVHSFTHSLTHSLTHSSSLSSSSFRYPYLVPPPVLSSGGMGSSLISKAKKKVKSVRSKKMNGFSKGNKKNKDKEASSNQKLQGRLIVFIAGGATASEMRAVHEVMADTGSLTLHILYLCCCCLYECRRVFLFVSRFFLSFFLSLSLFPLLISFSLLRVARFTSQVIKSFWPPRTCWIRRYM